MKEKMKPFLICSFFVLIQSILYLLAKLSPFSIHLIGNRIDNRIPFVPSFVIFYFSWYLLLFLIPLLINKKDKRLFYKYLVTVFISNCIAFLIYIIYPTTMIRPEVNINGIFGSLLKILYYIDYPIVNCFPSMHCIICFIFIFYALFEKCFSRITKYLIIVIGILIIASTLFIKQHVIIDVISAFVIALFVYLFVKNSKYLNQRILNIQKRN